MSPRESSATVKKCESMLIVFLVHYTLNVLSSEHIHRLLLHLMWTYLTLQFINVTFLPAKFSLIAALISMKFKNNIF